MDNVTQDIEQSKKHCSINEVQVIDGKITANFCYHENPEPMQCYREWISYKKVFDNWKGFSDYAEKFFNKLNASGEAED